MNPSPVSQSSLTLKFLAPKKNLFTYTRGDFSFELNMEGLKEGARNKSLVFVFSGEGNIWAQDIITRFTDRLYDWCEPGKAPEVHYIVENGSSSDLREKLRLHPAIKKKEVVYFVTVGDSASAAVVRFRTNYQRLAVPQLFCVTSDPSQLDLMRYEGRLVPNTTGVYTIGVQSYERQIRTLKALHGSVKNVGVVYDAYSKFDVMKYCKKQEAEKIMGECVKQGVEAHAVHLDGDIQTEGEKLMLFGKASQVDAFVTLKDCTVYKYSDKLAQYCEDNQIVYMASDLSSVMRGASIGFGCEPGAYAPALLSIIERRQRTGAPLHTIGVAFVEERTEVRHNMRNINKQIKNLPQYKRDLIEMVDISLSY